MTNKGKNRKVYHDLNLIYPARVISTSLLYKDSFFLLLYSIYVVNDVILKCRGCSCNCDCSA